ncbi:MAG TPA: protein kinase [Pseudonocardia sp.]|nr:protein kinase [Pseudonocardia sp.]
MPAPEQAREEDRTAEPRRIGDRYRLSDPLGRGAMGTVWAGYDEVLHRAVAVKELRVPPGVPTGEMVAMRERMMREARTLGGLSHPNVITLYDVVDVSGDPYVVLELLPSRNLSEVISDQGRLSVGQAASVGLAVAAALQAAHRANITHRDVKPGNVLVAHDGRIKLTDFGIARKRDDLTMTATGLVLGSPAYIAPEVAAGEAVTPAADLWGLGATLFASVEGRPPYDVEGDPVKTVTAVVHDEVPQTTLTGPLAEVISALMVKDPAGRLPLAEVRRRLRPLLADPDDPLFPGSPEAYTMPPSPAVSRPPAQDGGGSLPQEPPRPDRRAESSGAVAASRGPDSGERPPTQPPPPQQPPRPSPRPAPGPPTIDTGTNNPGTFGPSPRPATGSYGTIGPQPPGNPAPLAADPGPMPGGTGWGSPQVTHGPQGPPPVQTTGPLRTGGYQPNPYQQDAYQQDQYGAAHTGGYPVQGTGQTRPPLPPRPPQVSKPPPIAAKSGGSRAVPLLVAGALAVIVGTAGGWAGTRTLVGQSPMSTSLISPGAGSPASAMKTHVDSPTVYGPSALGFTVGVPRDWEEYRVAGDNDALSVLFVSPDGSRELRVDKIKGSRTRAAQVSDFVDTLTPAKLGVAAVTVQERTANTVRYRADRVGPQGTSSRVGYAQLTPSGTDLWVVQLTVPADAAGDTSQALFTSFVQGFHL